MNTKKLFIICGAVFLIHQFAQQILGYNSLFIDAYLDDLVCLPFVLFLISVERKWLLDIPCFYKFSKLEILVGTIVTSLIFELFLPYISDGFTYDIFDFVAYGVGGVAFYLVQKNEKTAHV